MWLLVLCLASLGRTWLAKEDTFNRTMSRSWFLDHIGKNMTLSKVYTPFMVQPWSQEIQIELNTHHFESVSFAYLLDIRGFPLLNALNLSFHSKRCFLTNTKSSMTRPKLLRFR